MRYLQGRSRVRRVLRSPFFAILILGTFILVTNSAWDVYKKNLIATINKNDSEKVLNDLTTERARLSSELERLNTARGVEDELRSKYRVTKPGEEELVVVDIGTSSSTTIDSQASDKSIWTEFLGLFKF